MIGRGTWLLLRVIFHSIWSGWSEIQYLDIWECRSSPRLSAMGRTWLFWWVLMKRSRALLWIFYRIESRRIWVFSSRGRSLFVRGNIGWKRLICRRVWTDRWVIYRCSWSRLGWVLEKSRFWVRGMRSCCWVYRSCNRVFRRGVLITRGWLIWYCVIFRGGWGDDIIDTCCECNNMK